jgi:hypothetical protein
MRRLFPVRVPHVAHERDADGNHVVSLAIRVLLYQQAGMWIAQSVDVDYAAAGNTSEEAKASFTQGLTATIHAHLQEHGSLAHFLDRQAPAEVMQQYLRVAAARSEVPVERQEIPPFDDSIPFPRRIEYLRLAECA